MDSMNIKDYEKHLEELCDNCKRSSKCKDHTKMCVAKQFAFTLTKMVYKRRIKKGVIK